MSGCSIQSKNRSKQFNYSFRSSTLNSFKPQNLTAFGTGESERLSELSSLANSEQSLEDWSTQSYAFSRSISSHLQGVESLSSFRHDLSLPEEATFSPRPNSDTPQISRQGMPQTPIPLLVPEETHCNDTLDNESQDPLEYYDESFVMPQVSVPSTKESEKSIGNSDIGYIKILVCGDSGIGKTSLINMFLSAPEIVAVHAVSDRDGENKSICSNVDTSTVDEKKSYESDAGFEGMEEILASTGGNDLFNSTLADADDDAENNGPAYNICLVDTIGYGAYLDAGAIISPITSYLEHQFYTTNTIFNNMQPNTNTLYRILINGHGAYTHVDVCLYIIFNRVKPVDYEYMRSIQHLCNVVPVLVKQDFYSTEQMNKRRYEVLSDLIDNGIEIYAFDHGNEDLLEMCRRGNPGVPPFTVSFDTATNVEWSSNPTLPPTTPDEQDHGSLHSSINSGSDFKSLKDILFYKGIHSLRRSTAGKFVRWRSTQLLQSRPHDPFRDDTSINSHDFTTLISSTLTTAETVDRLQRVKQAEVKKINLHIARFISDKRKEMEERMVEQEQQLKKQLDSASYKRRAHLLLAELAKLLLHSSADRAQMPSVTPQTQQAVTKRTEKRRPKTSTKLFVRMQLPLITPDVAKLFAACAMFFLPYYFGPWVYLISLCLLYCI